MPKKKPKGSDWHKLGLMDLAYILPATTVGGWLLGRWLQSKFGWPHWEVTGVTLGGLAGLLTLVQRLMYIAKKEEQEQLEEQQDNESPEKRN